MKHHHREPKHLNSNKNKCTVIYLCPCAFFESFRRYLNEAKAVYISGYYLISRFVIMMLRLRLKFRVMSLTINSHRGRHYHCINREKKQGVKLNESFRLVSDYSWVDQLVWFLAYARRHETMDGGLWVQFPRDYFINSMRQFQSCLLVSRLILCILSIFVLFCFPWLSILPHK